MTTALAQKRKKRAAVDRAVNYIIANPGRTYRQVGKMFGVRPGTIQRRIDYHYGNLEAARFTHREVKKWTRPCISCGCTKPRDYGLYRCEVCRKKASDFHDGSV